MHRGSKPFISDRARAGKVTTKVTKRVRDSRCSHEYCLLPADVKRIWVYAAQRTTSDDRDQGPQAMIETTLLWSVTVQGPQAMIETNLLPVVVCHCQESGGH
jgi:hypothetical protein